MASCTYVSFHIRQSVALFMLIVGSSSTISMCKDDRVISAREDDISSRIFSKSSSFSRSLRHSAGPNDKRDEDRGSLQA
jgi:hypothetical protein